MLHLDVLHLTAELPAGNAELARANDGIVTEYLARHEGADTVTRVNAKLLEQLPTGRATQRSVASALNMSVRTLQRRLQAADTSCRSVVEETRRDLAGEYIRQSNLSVQAIADLLGFSDPTSPSRSFRRWTGRSPGDFRG